MGAETAPCPGNGMGVTGSASYGGNGEETNGNSGSEEQVVCDTEATGVGGVQMS